jgi:hypothetical protein
MHTVGIRLRRRHQARVTARLTPPANRQVPGLLGLDAFAVYASMISTHKRTHPLQIATPGPSTIFRTAERDAPQKEH